MPRRTCALWLKAVVRAEDPKEFDKEEVVNVYELEGHPDHDYCCGDVVVRLLHVSLSSNTGAGDAADTRGMKYKVDGSKVENASNGETHVEFSDLSWVGNITGLKNGDIEVTWAYGMVSTVGPQAIYVVGRDDDDESIASGSDLSDAGSWETVDDDEKEVLQDSRQDIERENSSGDVSEEEESGENDFGAAAVLYVSLAVFRFVAILEYSQGAKEM